MVCVLVKWRVMACCCVRSERSGLCGTRMEWMVAFPGAVLVETFCFQDYTTTQEHALEDYSR